MRVALIKNGIVENVAVAPVNDQDPWYQAMAKIYDQIIKNEDVNRGDIYNNGTFSKPTPPPKPIEEVEQEQKENQAAINKKMALQRLHSVDTASIADPLIKEILEDILILNGKDATTQKR